MRYWGARDDVRSERAAWGGRTVSVRHGQLVDRSVVPVGVRIRQASERTASEDEHSG
jgi:hypothetical protein